MTNAQQETTPRGPDGEEVGFRGTSLFHTTEERDGMLESGMERGLTETHDRLAELLAKG